MASFLSQTSVTLHLNYVHKHIALWTHRYPQTYRLKCHGQSPTSNGENKEGSEPENVLLKMAWYGSELLGIAAAFFRRPSVAESAGNYPELAHDDSGAVDRDSIVETIKEDFQRSYFVTGNLTYSAYEENCEFADPAGSFRGLRRFTRNCSNFGSLIEKCNMKLMKWEDFEDKGIGHWRFSCILSFPWRPILSATGYTEYYFDAQSGKVCRHMEHWNVPKMTLLKQILKPSKRISRKGAISS
ncbi:hypothetical protein Nepgr_033154 [Nepenthes gracilis]|uniref:Uncharacterized protein n=1 Tax=Nepenthes gracilis TaxID=150966 RepID=A0AAD3TLL0_NEPGR|nr:hypothetical protein Nepgr_033154 [Nepenthes gracilis]